MHCHGSAKGFGSLSAGTDCIVFYASGDQAGIGREHRTAFKNPLDEVRLVGVPELLFDTNPWLAKAERMQYILIYVRQSDT
jgi:hypothetical protein